jgi:serine protease inhibitor
MPATLTLDRPFMFLIVDDMTESILFVGQVTDPTAG